MGESLKSKISVGIAKATLPYPTEWQIGMDELNGYFIDADATGAGRPGNLLDIFTVMTENINRQWLGSLINNFDGFF